MTARRFETETWLEPGNEPTFANLLPRSLVLGMLIAVVTSTLYSIDLLISEWLQHLAVPTFKGPALADLFGTAAVMGGLAIVPGLAGGVVVAAALRTLVRLRMRRGLAGALAGTIVGLFLSALFFLIFIGLYGQTGNEPSPLEWVEILAFVLVLPATMGAAHGLLLARWAYGEEPREQKLGASLLTVGGIAAFFLLCSVALGTIAGLQLRERMRTVREAAAIPPAVARDVCAKLALSPQDSRCRPGANVRAPDFFPEIRDLYGKGLTYEQIEAMFGTYKRSCGATMHKAPGDEGYFVCLYDLNGNEKYWFTFEFSASGQMTRVSTSSAPPPP